MHKILLAVTGSVATTQIAKLYSSLSRIGSVIVLATENAKLFLKNSSLPDNALVFFDSDEWQGDYLPGDQILHIELRKRASAMVVAPMSANTLAKAANGLCDNLVTNVIRAWDYNKPMILAPAMNTLMWDNPITFKHCEAMVSMGANIVQPVEKMLACGDYGVGAMAHCDTISNLLTERLRWDFPIGICSGIPINHHPGAFGFKRRRNIHTGVDLYTREGEHVRAVENGVIVRIDQFTGSALGTPFWLDTWAVMVEGASGVVNYGEIIPCADLQVGDHVMRHEVLGKVTPVLKPGKLRPDIPGHSTSMLHFELYDHGSREFAHWHTDAKDDNLLDPTVSLIKSRNAPFNILTWSNKERKTVG